MKKLCYLLIILLFTGCSELANTPTKQVEAFLKNYQAMDTSVISDLDKSVENENFTVEQKEKYKNIMKNHYQDLVYEIKDETINGESAVVTVEIEVTDFKRIIDETSTYLDTHLSEFKTNDNYDENKYNDYLLDKLESAKEKVKYTLYLSLTKVNDKWTINSLNDSIYEKINGMYDY